MLCTARSRIRLGPGRAGLLAAQQRASAAASIGSIRAKQSFGRRSIGFGACALIKHAAIPGEVEALQCIEYGGGCTGYFARWIDVLHTNEPLPLVLPCVEKACDSGRERAYMEGAGRRGSEPPDIARRPVAASHALNKRVLAILVVAIPVLAFGEFPALLGLDA